MEIILGFSHWRSRLQPLFDSLRSFEAKGGLPVFGFPLIRGVFPKRRFGRFGFRSQAAALPEAKYTTSCESSLSHSIMRGLGHSFSLFAFPSLYYFSFSLSLSHLAVFAPALPLPTTLSGQHACRRKNGYLGGSTFLTWTDS